MALMLAAGYTPPECEEIYKYACPLIFAADPWRVYNPMKAKYDPRGRDEICKVRVGVGLRMCVCVRVCVRVWVCLRVRVRVRAETGI